MESINWIELELPSTSVEEKQKKIQDDDPYVIYEYDYTEYVEVLSIEEPTSPQVGPDLGIDIENELVSATISYSFKSTLKEETL